ncbi:histidine kinase [Paenibacillus ehimensis]|uniref:sensor histidine kinase n=1 Tax=Paenibacillus ehimensis TaxID=79264 RepID=UPI001268858A
MSFRRRERFPIQFKLLGKLLRHNLEIRYQPVTLASEIDLVRTYLDNQRLRFGDKLTYELPEPPRLLCSFVFYERLQHVPG